MGEIMKKSLEKEKFMKEDGRYILFYKFKDDTKKTDKSKDQKTCRR